jgi:hypothetical protein
LDSHVVLTYSYSPLRSLHSPLLHSLHYGIKAGHYNHVPLGVCSSYYSVNYFKRGEKMRRRKGKERKEGEEGRRGRKERKEGEEGRGEGKEGRKE